MIPWLSGERLEFYDKVVKAFEDTLRLKSVGKRTAIYGKRIVFSDNDTDINDVDVLDVMLDKCYR